MKKSIITFVILSAVTFSLTGCNMLEWPTYVLFGQRTTKVKAEYLGLKDQKTIVIVTAEQGIDFEYPYARSSIVMATVQAIGHHVKGVEFVEQEKIENFQMENLDWAALPRDQIARKFGATRIVWLDLYQFTMFEEESLRLLRGNIRATVQVYEVDDNTTRFNRAAYHSEVAGIWPEQGPLAMSNSALERLKTQSIIGFAQQVAQKFYDHKRPVK